MFSMGLEMWQNQVAGFVAPAHGRLYFVKISALGISSASVGGDGVGTSVVVDVIHITTTMVREHKWSS